MTDHVKDICKIGQKSSCCRYLVMGSSGFECAKFTEHKATLDSGVALGRMNAQADNCEGLNTNQSLKLLNDENNSEKTD